MKTHEEMVAEWREDPEFQAEYDALEEEFAIFGALIAARKAAGLTGRGGGKDGNQDPGHRPPGIVRRQA